jgi:diguanylate cyclase (GGDEF)-like protein
VRLVDRIDSLHQRRDARPYRVLLIDDDDELAGHFAAVLIQHGFEVETLAHPRATLERIDGFRPDLVLLDLYMPECSGPELARVIRMREDWLALPIVFLSAETDYDLQLLASSEGADDFLVKPISDSQLVAAVRARCERSAQLAELMFRDSLTGLLKHSRIKEQLLQEVGRAVRHGRALCVAMIDIDHFKRVNDTHGHSVGDQVIRALAQLLRQRVRRIDSIGRYGGEEFLLLLPQCNIGDARVLLEDIRERFFSLRFQGANGQFVVSLSAGIASTDTAEHAADLLEQADQALYRAKDGGRNQIVLAV